MKKLIISLFFIGCYFISKADHITGGEIFYNYLGLVNGEHRYHVVVKLFKNCRSNRQFNNPTIISVFDRKSGARIQDITVPLLREEDLTLTNPSKCITNPPDVCLQIGYYEFNVSLPPSADGYLLTCQVVYRIAGIDNLIPNYGSIGATYTAEIPGGPAAENNSSMFTGSDLVVVCANNSFSYSFASKDDDGDELRYSFCDAYQGGFFNNGTATPPAQPPYSSVPYGVNYKGGLPLGKNVQIDNKTGLIKGIAPGDGIYVVTVCVEEVRNGVVIATQRKDLQVNVSSCAIASASLLPEYLICGESNSLSLSNFSTSPLISTYNWEIEDKSGTVVHTSSTQTVNYTFPDTGVYKIKLLINKGIECSDSMASTARVYPGQKTDFDISGLCFNKPSKFTSSASTVYGQINSLIWDFGENFTTDDFSTQQNPDYRYPSQGQKLVKLIVGTTTGCMDTADRTINILDKPPINLLFRDTLICKNDAVQLQVKGSGIYTWSPASSITGSNTSSPFVTPASTTTYYVDLDDDGCLNRDSVKVRVVDKVNLTAMNDTIICQGDAVQMRIQSDGLSHSWTPAVQLSNANIAQPIANTPATTTYEVTAAIGGCFAKEQIVIRTVPYPKVNAGIDTVVCYQSPAQLFATSDGSTFTWSPSNSLYAANTLTPVASPSETTAYVLTVFDTKGCPKPSLDTVVVSVLPPIKPFAGNDTTVVIGQPLQLTATGGVGYQWSPRFGLSADNIANPIATFNTTMEDVRYKVLVYNEAGCVDSAYTNVKIFGTPPTVFVPSAFTPNADGRNDVIRPIAAGMKKLEYFQVYNRWGQLVFSTSTSGRGWDGRISGQIQNSGTYIWIVKAVDFNGKPYTQKGTVTLIR